MLQDAPRTGEMPHHHPNGEGDEEDKEKRDDCFHAIALLPPVALLLSETRDTDRIAGQYLQHGIGVVLGS
jgi:hypothetical protein